MATYYVELDGGQLQADAALKGGTMSAAVSFSGAVIYPSQGGGGGGANLETKSVAYTPSELELSQTLLPSAGYDGFDEVDVSVDAIPSNYVGSGVPRRDSLDLTTSGATVNVPSGFYEYNSSATIPSAPLPTLSSATIDNSGNLGVTANLSGDGYLQSGTLPLTLANAFTVQGAQTITPTTTDQTISADQYLTGNQTILGDADLVPGNIKKDVEIFGVTGTYEGGGYDFWNKAYPTGAQSTTITSISAYVAYGRTGITSLSAPNATSINDYALYGCTGLTSVSLPVCTFTGVQSMRGCTNLLSVSLPSLKIIGGSTGSTSKTHLLDGCTKLTDVWMPKVYYFQGYEFAGCSALTGLDFPLLKTIKGNAFQNCTNLKVLILRRSEAATVSNINSFSGTPFASSGTGGTLYVPNDLISTYQSASVWSTLLGYANNSIVKIEGSPYENYYYNGNPITS